MREVNAGELRTMIKIESKTVSQDADGFAAETWTNVFGADVWVYCHWNNAYGHEFYEAMGQNLREPATITMRYSPLVQPNQRLFLTGDQIPYEIISVNNVENLGAWMEIKVQRVVNA